MAPQQPLNHMVVRGDLMNLKNKLIGFGAASILALTMTTGVMAQTSTTGAGVELVPGQCSVQAKTSNINFGEWQWDGSKYVPPTVEQWINWSVTNGYPGEKCHISITLEGGALASENGDTIPGSYLTFRETPLSSAVEANLATGDYQNRTRMTSVPDNIMPGNYSGTLNFQIVEAQ
jgi:type 1 fimbria pilin